jgi:hypothetical protein
MMMDVGMMIVYRWNLKWFGFPNIISETFHEPEVPGRWSEHEAMKLYRKQCRISQLGGNVDPPIRL